MIRFEDFTETHLDDHPVPYYEWNDGEVRICLESCVEGYCVGIYDADDWILAEKKCTNMPGKLKIEQQTQAIALANIIYDNWKEENVIV